MQVLRPLRPDDLDFLIEIERAGAIAGLGHIFPQEGNPFPTEQVRARWAEEIDDPTVDCFAVIHEGELAGFAATQGDQFLHFGTRIDSWGSGLAGRPHDEVVEHLVRQGHQRAWLRVFEENRRAIAFYLRRGWVATEHMSRSTFAPYPVLRRFELDLHSPIAQ